ncbi:MAG: hypothetical protein WCR06_04350 [bacterium]
MKCLVAVLAMMLGVVTARGAQIAMTMCRRPRSRWLMWPGRRSLRYAAVAAVLAWSPCGAGYGQNVPGASTNTARSVSPPRINVSTYMITREASLYSYKGSNASAKAVLLINCQADPSNLVTSAAMELAEVRDDTGKVLREGSDASYSPDRDQSRMPLSPSAAGNWQNLYNVQTRFPALHAKRIPVLKGKLVLTTTVPAEPTRISLDSPGQTFHYFGHDFAFDSVSANEKEGVVVTFSCRSNKEPPDAMVAHAWFKKATLLGSKGEKRAYMSSSRRKTPGQPVALIARFKWSKDSEPIALLLANEAEPLSQEYPFAYHDLPLPPLTSAYASSTPVTADTIPALPAAPPPAGTTPLSELASTPVTLTAQESPVERVTEEIARLTGIPLTFRKQSGRTPPATPRISVDWQAVPYWTALEELCRKGNLIEEYYPSLDVLRGHGERPASQRPKQVVVGPVRVQINEVQIKTASTSRFPGGGSSPGAADEMTFQLNGSVMVEPHVAIISQGCQVDRCIASSGVDLANVGWTNNVPPPAWAPPHTWRINGEGTGSRNNFSLGAPLLPAIAPARIAHLRLNYYLKTGGKLADYEIPDTSKAGACLLSDGLSLRWSEPQASGSGVNLSFVFARESGLTQNDLTMLEGGKYSISGVSGVKLAAAKSSLSQKEYAIQCAIPAKADLPAKLRISVPGGITTYAASIDFHDIALPTLPPPWQ